MIDVGFLLQKCDIGLVLSQLGIEYEVRNSKRGHELYFSCPTDNHKNDPHKKRCSIAESGSYKGQFNCWACDFNGNLIHLIRFMLGYDFKQAVSFIENRFGSAEVVGVDLLKFKLRMSKPATVIDDELPKFILPDDYQPLLSVDNSVTHDVRKWLYGRNIGKQAIDRYHIGLTHDYKYGLMCVIPIIFNDDIVSIFRFQPRDGGVKRYPKNSPQGKIFFNYDNCLKNRSYVLVESILDVIKIWSITKIESMACFTNMISDEQIALLRNFNEHGVMPDLDGLRGWDLVNRIVPHVGKSLWVYLCPVGKDPGDCTISEIENAVKNRIRYCDYQNQQNVTNSYGVNTHITSIYKK